MIDSSRMTNQEILTKAIQKVAKSKPELVPIDVTKIDRIEYFDGVVTYWSGHQHWTFNIFNHEFAKALWGEEECKYCIEKYSDDKTPETHFAHNIDGDYNYEIPAWQYHLREMVIAENPIKYLGENI